LLWRSFDHVNLAESLLLHGQYDAALVACAMGLEQAPGSPALYVNAARALDGLDRVEDALSSCAAALAAQTADEWTVAALIERARIANRLGDRELALESARAALAIAPDDVAAHAVLAEILLARGELAEGLAHVERHWLVESAYFAHRFHGISAWDGHDLAGRCVLAVHHQGAGDMLFAARYFPLLRRRAARLVVEAPQELAELLRAIDGVDDIIEPGSGDVPREFDAYVRVMSLPRLFVGEGGAMGDAVPYLRTVRERRKRWSEIVPPGAGMRVGLAWAGNAQHQHDLRRSIPLEAFESASRVEGIAWYSLVKGAREDDASPAGMSLTRLGPRFESFADTAAAIEQLDLVITVDTAVAHLAGALGKPVWMLAARYPDWRWSGDSERTPWYPSMRIVRETSATWSSALDRVAADLLRLLA
jgi:tetratricopeptide (TPR) repeat protein